MNVKESISQKDAGLQLYMQSIIHELQTDKKHAAVHTYTCTLHSFLIFRGRVGECPLPLSDVFTPGCLKDYQEWLLKKGLSWNTVSTYMRTLRAVYNRLCPPGSADHNLHLFNQVFTKVVSQTKRSLSREQTERLASTDIGSLPKELQPVFAYFLLMFLFRGMPFIDLAYLRKRDVQGNVIVYCRHKTGKQMTVRIPRQAAELLRQYKSLDPSSPYLFPILDGRLHDEGDVYRCYQSALRKFNKQLCQLASILLPGAKLSSYTPRHTWATLSYHLGVEVGIISAALGHSSIRVTETYLKPFANERVDNENDRLITSVVKSRKEFTFGGAALV